jgi:DNA-binding response OmpR family regulator
LALFLVRPRYREIAMANAPQAACNRRAAAPPAAQPGRAGSILVIEDDADIANVVRLHLEDAGYEVTVAADGLQGAAIAGARRFDLLILDLMLPGIDGLEICRRLAGGGERTPILMLTARSGEYERVLGLELGADDYLTKPFSVLELMARVKAVLRRVQRAAEASEGACERLSLGPLVIDRARHRVTLAAREVPLTAKEFELLWWFARHPGRVFNRAQLLDAVWGYDSESYEHTVNSHLNRLRNKLEQDPARPRLIVTVRGVGYKLVAPDGCAPAP